MNEMSKQQAIAPRDYHDVIAKVASLKDLDVEKLSKMMQMQEDWERRQAATHYNEMMSQAQAAMTTVSKDSVNPVTRSRYASLAALDDAIRPIYTRYGFSIEFNEEHAGEKENGILLAIMVSNGAETRRRTKYIPVQTTGIGGRVAMTATHASIAAVTYGRRALLKMVFNIAEDDDDGNRAGGHTPRPEKQPATDPTAEAFYSKQSSDDTLTEDGLLESHEQADQLIRTINRLSNAEQFRQFSKSTNFAVLAIDDFERVDTRFRERARELGIAVT